MFMFNTKCSQICKSVFTCNWPKILLINFNVEKFISNRKLEEVINIEVSLGKTHKKKTLLQWVQEIAVLPLLCVFGIDTDANISTIKKSPLNYIRQKIYQIFLILSVKKNNFRSFSSFAKTDKMAENWHYLIPVF